MGLKKLVDKLLKRKNQDNTSEVKVIIEGGNQGDWNNHQIDRCSYCIPNGINQIKIGGYNLDLVMRLDEVNILEQIESVKNPNSLKLDYNYFSLRPATLITFDGRIYYDQSLGPERLNSFLESLTYQSVGLPSVLEEEIQIKFKKYEKQEVELLAPEEVRKGAFR